jgi:hypothetical protein
MQANPSMSTDLERPHRDEPKALRRELSGAVSGLHALRAELQLLAAPERKRIALYLWCTAIAFFAIALTAFYVLGMRR